MRPAAALALPRCSCRIKSSVRRRARPRPAP
jgi:hypothetical protein